MRSAVMSISPVAVASGGRAAVEAYRRLGREHGEEHYFDELELNALGLQLLFGRNRADDALTVLALNIEEHPRSYNVYDTMGNSCGGRGGPTTPWPATARASPSSMPTLSPTRSTARTTRRRSSWSRRARRSLAPAVARRRGGAWRPAFPTTGFRPPRRRRRREGPAGEIIALETNDSSTQLSRRQRRL